MKIKEVCAKTGLTDRTVRFYIEEGLIFPAYTENYLGRKAFDFSESDVEALRDIAVLREFDFSVEEIRRLLNDPESSGEVIADVRARTEERVAAGRQHAQALAALDGERAYTVSELARLLSFSEEPTVPTDTGRTHVLRRVLGVLRAIAMLAVLLSPPAFGVTLPILRAKGFVHPVAEPLFIFLLIVTMLPTLFACVSFLLPRLRRWIPTRVLIVACLCAIPLSAILGAASVSECMHTWRDFSTEVAVCHTLADTLRALNPTLTVEIYTTPSLREVFEKE